MATKPKKAKITARSVAEQIAADVFVNGAGMEADRLVLTDADDRDLGGWGRKPFVDRVEKIILAAFGKDA